MTTPGISEPTDPLWVDFIEHHLEHLKQLKAANDRKINLCAGYASPWNDPLIKEARQLDKEIAETEKLLKEAEG